MKTGPRCVTVHWSRSCPEPGLADQAPRMPRADAIRTRAVHFAVLAGPPRPVPREVASEVHSSLCDTLRWDDIAFRYRALAVESKSGAGFEAMFERPEGRGGFKVVLGAETVGAPIKVHFIHQWPPSLEGTVQLLDPALDAVFSALGKLGEWQRVRAEVRIRASANLRTGGTGVEFLQKHLTHVPNGMREALGEIPFLSFSAETSAAATFDSPLEGPARHIKIEVLREDPSGLYVELVETWPQVPDLVAGQAQKTQMTVTLRPADLAPSEYVRHAYSTLQSCVKAIGSSKGKGKKQ